MAQLVVLTFATLILCAGVGVHAWDRIGANRLAARSRVLVQLHSGKAFTGVQWRRRGRLLVLKGAEMLEPNNQPAAMDGDVVIDRAEVDLHAVTP